MAPALARSGPAKPREGCKIFLRLVATQTSGGGPGPLRSNAGAKPLPKRVPWVANAIASFYAQEAVRSGGVSPPSSEGQKVALGALVSGHGWGRVCSYAK